MKLSGYLKIAVFLLVLFTFVYGTLGVEAAVLLTFGIVLYAWLGEYLELLKDGAIRMDHLHEYERNRLSCALADLSEDVNRVSGADISKLRLHVIPSDNMNACAYGFRNIGVTRAMLNNCDDATLCAVVAHEVSHTFCMDAVFYRLVFASVTILIVGLICLSVASTSVIWIIFAVLCALGLCGGLFSMFLFQGLSKLVKGYFTLMQRAVLFVYQTVMACVSRRCEYRADHYSCELGYGPQLSYFLQRFVESQETGHKSLHEVIYASHPPTHKRILRIEQNCTDLICK